MTTVDLDTLLCRSRARPYMRRRRGFGGADRETDLTVAELAGHVVRAELWLRERGKSLLGPNGTLIWLAQRRAARVPLARPFRTRDGELEAGLVWLATRGLVEAVGPEDEQRYRWTGNATVERLRRWVR